MLLSGKRIFMVEDDVGNRSVAQFILESHGATLAFDRWGTDAVLRMRAFLPIDIILMDLMLPLPLTGFDVYDQIQRHAEFANIPVVAVSATDIGTVLLKLKAKGFRGFISKPISLRNFPQRIAAAINGEEVWSFP